MPTIAGNSPIADNSPLISLSNHFSTLSLSLVLAAVIVNMALVSISVTRIDISFSTSWLQYLLSIGIRPTQYVSLRIITQSLPISYVLRVSDLTYGLATIYSVGM